MESIHSTSPRMGDDAAADNRRELAKSRMRRDPQTPSHTHTKSASSKDIKDDGDEYDDEEREKERDEVAVRCLRITSVLLLIFGALLCGGALYASTIVYASLAQTLAYALAGVGGAILGVNTLGAIAVCRRPHVQMLLLYYTCLVVLCFASLAVGGFAFVLTDSAVATVRDQWDEFVAGLPADKRAVVTRESAESVIRAAMYACGALCILMFLCSASAMNHATRLLTPVRAYTILLQATNLVLLPIGIAMIGVAAFVADTAVGAEASVAAFSLFILGVFVLCLLLIGCAGTSLHSRGIIRLFMVLTLLLGVAFLAFGVLALVQADLLAAFITSQWDYVRRILPPDFAGRYDKEQFAKYIATNLTAMGFLALCAGVLQMTQMFASFRLRAELKLESELEQEAFEAVDKGLVTRDVAETISRAREVSSAQRIWKQQWTKGTTWSRRLILCGCISICTLVFVAVALAGVALYFSMSCASIASFAETQLYDGQDFGPYVYVHNNYSLGRVSVSINSSATQRWTSLTFRKSAYKPDMALSGWPEPQTRNVTIAVAGSSGAASTAAAATIAVPDSTLGASTTDILGTGAGTTITAKGIQTEMKAPTTMIGYDMSCQNSEIAISLPIASAIGGNTRAAGDVTALALEVLAPVGTGGINLDFSGHADADKPRIRRAQLSAGAGPIDVRAMLIGSKGLQASTTSGEISVSDTRADCDPLDLGESTGGIRLATDKGAMSLNSVQTRDCDVVLMASAAMSRVFGSVFTNTLGGATLSITGNKGVIEVQNSRSDIFDIKGDEGSVRVRNVTVLEALKVASSTGLVYLQQLRVAARAGVQVETDSGSIEIWASQFAGIISIVTGGRISCIGSGFDDAAPCVITAGGTVDSSGAQTLSVVEQVTVNCRSRGDCPYLGQISITSTRGNVLLRMDTWTR